jgi:hypothetical protein
MTSAKENDIRRNEKKKEGCSETKEEKSKKIQHVIPPL